MLDHNEENGMYIKSKRSNMQYVTTKIYSNNVIDNVLKFD